MSHDGSRTLVDFTHGKKLVSREALWVYLNNFDAYKLFRFQDQAQQAYQAALLAKNAGLPIARETKAAYKAIFVEEGGTRTEVWVLQSERHIGEFFQLSKQGQINILVQKIKASRQPEVRKRAIRAFQAAKDHKITDPQGFFDSTLGMPIRFFDVHTGAAAAPQIQNILDLLNS